MALTLRSSTSFLSPVDPSSTRLTTRRHAASRLRPPPPCWGDAGADDSRQGSARRRQGGVPVYVMLPLDTVGGEGKLSRALAASLVAGGPGRYDWEAYVELVRMVHRAALRLQMVMSFHQCGINVDDYCQYQETHTPTQTRTSAPTTTQVHTPTLTMTRTPIPHPTRTLTKKAIPIVGEIRKAGECIHVGLQIKNGLAEESNTGVHIPNLAGSAIYAQLNFKRMPRPHTMSVFDDLGLCEKRTTKDFQRIQLHLKIRSAASEIIETSYCTNQWAKLGPCKHVRPWPKWWAPLVTLGRLESCPSLPP